MDDQDSSDVLLLGGHTNIPDKSYVLFISFV